MDERPRGLHEILIFLFEPLAPDLYPTYAFPWKLKVLVVGLPTLPGQIRRALNDPQECNEFNMQQFRKKVVSETEFSYTKRRQKCVHCAATGRICFVYCK